MAGGTHNAEDGGEEAGFVVGCDVHADLLGWARRLGGRKGFGGFRGQFEWADGALP